LEEQGEHHKTQYVKAQFLTQNSQLIAKIWVSINLISYSD